MTNQLFIVATPIGNMEDISFRAISTLKDVDIIFAEDTRVSKYLLQKFKIDKKCLSLHAQNEIKQVDFILSQLRDGKNIAIISDAGTPGISDPSVIIVSEAKKAGFQVIPIPGSSALIAALSVSGIPSKEFYFMGFLPNKKGRQTAFEKMKSIQGSIVLYESPYRVEKTLEQIYQFLGNRVIMIGREITKIHEEFPRAHVKDFLDKKINLKIKGEFVIIIADENFKLS